MSKKTLSKLKKQNLRCHRLNRIVDYSYIRIFKNILVNSISINFNKLRFDR